MAITFKDFLFEEMEDGKNNIFNFHTLKLKVLPKLQTVLDTKEEDDIPLQADIELMDLIQLIKQLVVEHIDHEDFTEMVKDDIVKSIKLMYPSSNVNELIKVIDFVIIKGLENTDIEVLKANIDSNDFSMVSKDEFGKLLFRIYTKELTKGEVLSNQDLSSIKVWINKLKHSNNSLSAMIRNRVSMKNKLFDKITPQEEFDDFEEETV